MSSTSTTAGSESRSSRGKSPRKTQIIKADRIRINEDIRMIIRDINAVILGIMEHGNATIRLNQCSALIITYLAECDEYYSGRSKGDSLPQTMLNFERLLEKLIELHTSTVPAKDALGSQ